MKGINQKNKNIWEKRYHNNIGIATWPFDKIISMVMRRFAAIDNRKSIKILDYGCGGGNNFWFLIHEGFDGFACDISKKAISITKDRIESEENMELSDEHYKIVDIDDKEPLPYKDKFFSAIIDREALSQSSFGGIKSRVKEFRRILVPGGWYLGVNCTDQHPDVSHASYLSNGDWNDFQKGIFYNQGRRHLFSITDIKELFSDWSIDHILLNNVSSIININAEEGNTSEYIIAAKTPE